MKMKHDLGWSGAALLLLGPVLAVIDFPIVLSASWRVELPNPYRVAVVVSSSLFAIGMGLWLFFESASPPRRETPRQLQVLVALLGLAISTLLLGFYRQTLSLQDLSAGLFLGAPAIGVISPTRKGRRKGHLNSALTLFAMLGARLPLGDLNSGGLFVVLALAGGAVYSLSRSVFGSTDNSVAQRH